MAVNRKSVRFEDKFSIVIETYIENDGEQDQVEKTEGVTSSVEINYKGPRLYTCFRGKEEDDENGGDYGGVFFTNSVRLSSECSPIVLRRIGFFGPFKAEKAEYDIWIDIFRSLSPICDPGEKSQIRVKRIQTKYMAKKKEIYYIDIPNGLFMQGGCWYHIQFMLDGEKTAKIKYNGTFFETSVDVELADGIKTVEFSWSRGSHQMPVIAFSIPTEKEMLQFIPIEKIEYPKLPLFCNIL